MKKKKINYISAFGSHLKNIPSKIAKIDKARNPNNFILKGNGKDFSLDLILFFF